MLTTLALCRRVASSQALLGAIQPRLIARRCFTGSYMADTYRTLNHTIDLDPPQYAGTEQVYMTCVCAPKGKKHMVVRKNIVANLAMMLRKVQL